MVVQIATCRSSCIQSTILTHIFFSWPYQAVLSSRPHIALQLLGRKLLNLRLAAVPWPSKTSSHSQALLWLTSLFWPKAETPKFILPVSHVGIYISFHNTFTFPLNNVSASAYFHMWILCRESLIDCSVNGQYATRKRERKVNVCL